MTPVNDSEWLTEGRYLGAIGIYSLIKRQPAGLNAQPYLDARNARVLLVRFITRIRSWSTSTLPEAGFAISTSPPLGAAGSFGATGRFRVMTPLDLELSRSSGKCSLPRPGARRS